MLPDPLAIILAKLAVALPIVVLPWFYGGVQSTVQVWLSLGIGFSVLCLVWAVRV